ncbi:hypothetical protein J2T17_003008 [Paenibacillus mucilaginosus]|uniref:hypothetical protein n=1 Tax=Paenibacillus mucilaginosus TaxID=61624 RepID=UPI003D203B45
MENAWIFLTAFFFYWPTAFTLSLVLFRQQVKPYRSSIFISSLIMANITYIIQSGQIPLGIAVVQPLVTLLCFWLIFKIKLTHSLIVFISYYVFNFITEVIFYIFLSQLTDSSFIILARDSVFLPFLFLTLVNFITASVLHKYRLGFSFVSFYTTRSNISHLLPITIACLLSACTATASLYLSHKTVIPTVAIVFVAIGIILYQFYRKEMSE